VSTPDLRALQRHLAAARDKIGAGDREAALEEIDAALAVELATTDSSHPQTGLFSDSSEATQFDLDLHTLLSSPSAPPEPLIQPDTLVAPGATLPSGVSAQGWAQFEQKVIRRRVERRLEVARAAIAGKRPREAREALDEVRELDPEHVELAPLLRKIEALAPTLTREVPPRSGPRLMAVMVFGAVILAASWIGSPRRVSYTVSESDTPRGDSSSVPRIPEPSREVSVVSDGAAGQVPTDTVSQPAAELVTSSFPDPAPENGGPASATQRYAEPEIRTAQPRFPSTATAKLTAPAALEHAGRLVLPVGAVVPPAPPPVDAIATEDSATRNAAQSPPEPRPAEPTAAEPTTLETRAAEPRAPEPRSVDATVARPAIRVEDAPIVLEKTEPSRTVDTEPPLPPAVDDEALVKGTLQAYRSAYDGLDVSSAQRVWPAVDRLALARAFHNLESQRLTFDACNVRLEGPAASAVCRGSAQYILKMGNRTTRVEPRVWSFTLRKIGEAWTIETARADRSQ
jgi:hypothetical protein